MSTHARIEALVLPHPVFREASILRGLEQLPYNKIARIVEIPVGTVMSRLARAHARAMQQRSPLLHAIRGRAAGAER